MANIRLKELVEANVDPKLVARSKETGKLVYFKSPENKAAAIKAGSHLDPKDKKDAEPNVDANPNDMFGGDYAKDRGAKSSKSKNVDYFAKIQKLFKDNPGLEKYTIDQWNKLSKADSSNNDSNWMDDLDSIDTSDIKGKADPNADSFTSRDLYGATFKDPQTGKLITVGDAYEREDDSEAYKKAFAYVSKFDPDKEAVVGTQAYDDLNKKTSPEPKITANWKPDEDGKMSFDAATDVQNHLNAVLGTDDGVAEVDYYGGSIDYHLSDGENSIYVGPHYDNSKLYAVSFQGPTMAIDKIEASYKTFKNPKDALKYAGELAKANKEGLEQKQESTKLTSMIKR